MAQQLKYAYIWSKDVINAFFESYPRATYYLSGILDMEPGELRHHCCVVLAKGKSRQWRVLKRTIQALDRYSKEDIERLKPEERLTLYKCLLLLSKEDDNRENNPDYTLDSGKQSELEL